MDGGLPRGIVRRKALGGAAVRVARVLAVARGRRLERRLARHPQLARQQVQRAAAGARAARGKEAAARGAVQDGVAADDVLALAVAGQRPQVVGGGALDGGRGRGVGLGSDYTIYATVTGRVKFDYASRLKKRVNVVASAPDA